MSENKIIILITVGLLLITAVFFYTIKDEAEDYRASISKDIVVEQTWQLPAALKEVSGIAFLEQDKIACVQDEKGSVFIYNLKNSGIEKEIPFAGPGDYEGIAVNNGIVYVMRADGTIFRIRDLHGEAEVETFETSFTAKNDMEGLFYDASNEQLLMAVKERDPNSKDFKGIYGVDPETMELDEQPLYQINFTEDFFRDKNRSMAPGKFFPSEVARHPKIGDLIVLEAREPKLLVMDPEGNPKKLHRLDRKLFPQPEGIAFDASGNLYISSEGEPGLIHRVTINQN